MKLLRVLVVVSILGLLGAGAGGARAAETVTLRGSVLLPDGQPAAGARVLLAFLGAKGWKRSEVSADTAGKFSLEVASVRQDTRVEALALRSGFAAAWTLAAPSEEITLQLGANPVPFAGVVTGPDGKPVAGAEVGLAGLLGLTAWGNEWISLGGTAAWRMTTGPDGRFSFPGLAAGVTVEYSVSAAGMVAVNDRWPLGQGDLTVALVRGATVAGRVLTDDKPVTGLVVIGTRAQTGYTTEARTGADGTYTLDGFAPGTVVLRVADPPAGLGSSVRVGTIATAGQALTGQDLILTPGALLSGKVTAAATGAALAHISLIVAWAPPGAEKQERFMRLPYPVLPGAVTQFYAATGPEGTYQLRVPPGRVLVYVSGHPAGSTAEWIAHPPQRRFNLAEGETYPGLNFALTAAPQLHGRVLRPDGTPAAGVEVIVASGYYNPSAPPLLTDAQGRFVADLPRFRGRGPARSLPILARDPATGQVGLTFVGGPQDQADIRLDTGGYLDVTAVDGAGRPQADVGLLVYLTAANGRPSAMLPGGVTDAQGRLRLGPLPLGVDLRVFPNWQQRAFLLDTAWDNLGLIKLHAGKDRELPVLHIDLRGRNVSGTVLDADGHPAAGALVLCSLVRPQMTRADDQGNFTLTGLPRKGYMQLLAVDATRPLFAVVPLSPEDRNGMVLRLQALGALTGMVVDAAGQPVAGAEVLLRDPLLPMIRNNPSLWTRLTAAGYTPAAAVTDAAGRWQAPALLPGGPYTLLMSVPARGLRGTAMATVQAGQTTDLGKLTVAPTASPGSAPLPPPPLPGAAGPAPPD